MARSGSEPVARSSRSQFLTLAMATGRLEDIGQRKPASLEIEHATVEMVIEQLGRKARASFVSPVPSHPIGREPRRARTREQHERPLRVGSEDCKFKSNTRDYTMQITRCVEE